MDANGEFTTGLVKEIFETVAMTDCSFTIEPRDVTKNSVLLEVTPERNDVSYYVAYVERKAFENDFHGSDSELMQATVAQIRSNMALTGATWSDFVHLGAKSFPVASLLSGTDYYAFAFGLDRGAITTDISKKPFRTAAAELTTTARSISASSRSEPRPSMWRSCRRIPRRAIMRLSWNPLSSKRTRRTKWLL